ncbi:gasdermin-D isoform X8 [Camelus bactrianus]|uniref:Gasdermin-D isoform X8 n=1 Tax=Camelus bactrianus TaxID=9837 RepID=A0AC58PG11_CAMBA
MGPQLWSRSSCGAGRPLPLPRDYGRAAEGQCEASGPRTGEDLRQGRGVQQLQCLSECVHAASGPQHLGSHAPREAPAEARAQNPADAEGGGDHPDPQAGGLGPVCTAWSHLFADILLFPNKKQRTFSGPLQAGRTGPGSQPEPSLRISDQRKFLSDGLMEDQLETTEDFQGLQLEVGVWAAGLEGLSEEPCGQLLGGLGQVLQDEHALEALEELLERGLCGGQVEPQDGPVGAILECLVLPSRQLEEELAGPVSYLLGALAVLSETQHVLLAEVLEMGALSEVFRLVRGPGLKGRAGLDAWSPHLPPPILSCQVRSLLEQSSPWQERRAVSLPPELLGSSWGAEAPSWVLLEECGLAPQAGDPQVCWEPEARCCTSALYACLALLSKLSPPC